MHHRDIDAYFCYWGKTPRTAVAARCHLLVYHCLDVAATGRLLLEKKTDWSYPLADRLGVDRTRFVDLFVYCLALHDIGKFARSFQGLAEPATPHLVAPDRRFTYDRKHDALGAVIWQAHIRDQIPALSQDMSADPLDGFEFDAALDLWLGGFFGHHGKPVETGQKPFEADFLAADQAAAADFAIALDDFFHPIWPLEQFNDPDWRVDALAPATWPIAGIAVLADWIGSNADYFGYCDQPMPLDRYWHDRALPRAEKALAATGFLQPAAVRPFPGFASAFELSPTPLQAWADTVDLASGPQLFLLEDITGAGKTEAALTLAHRLLAGGNGNGLYFGLPTMATSNAMYERLGAHYRAMFAAEAAPSLVLSHGARRLSAAFKQSIVPEPNADRAYSHDDTSAGIECRAWLADNRKKALLAEVGVGTIDQALLGVLPRKHQALRLLGLANKVLIVDEVHAYDTYTADLLQTLLRAHAANNGSAILLSATMPERLRRAFIAAWRAGRGLNERNEPLETGFPLATHVDDHSCREHPVAARPASRRSLPVAFVHDTDSAMGRIIAAARAGRCACWIRNTVDDAVAAYTAVREALGPEASITLFHARFTLADRQRIEDETRACFGKHSGADERRGRVLIATQVVEQSLDLDFDVLVSDLAPIELLIQRAGRLHRHPRNTSGDRLADGETDAREPPTLHVLAPEWRDEPGADWLKRLLPGTTYVYANPVWLWRTCRILRAEGGINLPERARTLLEAVYGEENHVPKGLQAAENDYHATQSVNRGMARFNTLRLDQGYTLAIDGAGWSDDQEIGTRLSDEATTRVALVVEDEGILKPRHHDYEAPWAMSTLGLREGLARRLPDLPAHLAPQAEQIRERLAGLRGVRFWLPDGDLIIYDGECGAVVPRKSGNNEAI